MVCWECRLCPQIYTCNICLTSNLAHIPEQTQVTKCYQGVFNNEALCLIPTSIFRLHHMGKDKWRRHWNTWHTCACGVTYSINSEEKNSWNPWLTIYNMVPQSQVTEYQHVSTNRWGACYRLPIRLLNRWVGSTCICLCRQPVQIQNMACTRHVFPVGPLSIWAISVRNALSLPGVALHLRRLCIYIYK